MHVKRFNAQSAIQRTTQGVKKSIMGLASAVVSIQTLIVVWYVDFLRKNTVS